MRLIDADALCDDVMERYCKDCEKRNGIKRGKWRVIYEIGEAPCRACDVDDLKMELDEAPTIEAEPIRHGKWMDEAEDWRHQIEWFKCSLCDFPTSTAYQYCPNCGARMDEVNDDSK